ncbi:MAG: hypothetical protein U0414_41740 [Polyangiaceae bacterium]
MPRRLAPFLLALALGALLPTRAFADSLSATEVAARRGLIEEAQQASAAGDHARALDLANRAGNLAMSVSLRRFIAEEQLALGKPADALGSAEVCAKDARAARADDHVAACERIIELAKPEVGYVVVSAPPGVQGARVRVNEHDLPDALIGQRYVVDPGDVVVDATADEAKPFRVVVKVARGAAVDVPIVFVATPKPLAPKAASKEAAPRFVLSPLVPIGAAVAGASLLTAISVGVSGAMELSEYEDRCTVPGRPASCGAERTTLQSDLDVRGTVVNVAIGVGVAGLVTGAIGLFMSGSKPSKPASARFGVIVF